MDFSVDYRRRARTRLLLAQADTVEAKLAVREASARAQEAHERLPRAQRFAARARVRIASITQAHAPARP